MKKIFLNLAQKKTAYKKKLSLKENNRKMKNLKRLLFICDAFIFE